MNKIVIYSSKTGFTKQYAKWLAEELKGKAIESKSLTKKDLEECDTIIYGGGIRASNICGLKSTLSKLGKLGKQPAAVFAVGATAYSEAYQKTVNEHNLLSRGFDYPFFYMQGGFDPKRLDFFLKFVFGRFSKSLRKKEKKHPEKLTEQDKQFLDFFYNSRTDVDKGNIKKLVEYIQSID